MNILLFGAKEHGTEVAKVLKNLGHNIDIVYLLEEPHEKIYYEHLKDFALNHNIEAISHKKAKKNIILSIIKRKNIDFILCIKWRYMISEELINETKYGGFVIHDSLLPKYRGFAPLNWAIIKDETEVGATFFKIADEMDAGPIISQKKLFINENEYISTIEKKMVSIYREIIYENISKIRNENKFFPQNEEEATYCCMRRPEDSKIEWTKSAKEIHNFVRALAPPFPSAFTFYAKQKIAITKTDIHSENDKYVGRIPGRILSINSKGIQVLTGKGILLINEIKVGGKSHKPNKFFKTIKKKLE